MREVCVADKKQGVRTWSGVCLNKNVRLVLRRNQPGERVPMLTLRHHSN